MQSSTLNIDEQMEEFLEWKFGVPEYKLSVPHPYPKIGWKNSEFRIGNCWRDTFIEYYEYKTGMWRPANKEKLWIDER